jgi:hypothetical protein
VLIWWIVCLWIDEPGSARAMVVAEPKSTEALSANETGDA